MRLWIGLMILCSILICLVLCGFSGILFGTLPFGDESTHGVRARTLGIPLILMGLFFAYIIRILATGRY
jgi:hypothetical protein